MQMGLPIHALQATVHLRHLNNGCIIRIIVKKIKMSPMLNKQDV